MATFPLIVMLEKNYINEYLQRTYCYKCGNSMEGARLETITEAPVALVAYAVCASCQAESVVTITTSGSGVTPLISDLGLTEFKKFMGVKSVSYDELLDLHKLLKKKSICNLLDKKENY